MGAVALAAVFLFLTVHPSPAARYWSKRFDEGDDLGTAVAAVTGGGVVGAGETDNDAWIVKFDEDGTVDWEYTYPVGDSSVFYSIVESLDEDYFCAVGTAVESGDRDLYAICVDATDGDIYWQRTYQPNSNDRDDEGWDLVAIDDADASADMYDGGWSVAEDTEDGDIYFGGESLDSIPDMEWWVLKLDASTGNVKSTGTGCAFDDPNIDPNTDIQQEGDSTTITAAQTPVTAHDPEGSKSSTSLTPETLCEHTP